MTAHFSALSCTFISLRQIKKTKRRFRSHIGEKFKVSPDTRGLPI
jgi:hypothetical protein